MRFCYVNFTAVVTTPPTTPPPTHHAHTHHVPADTHSLWQMLWRLSGTKTVAQLQLHPLPPPLFELQLQLQPGGNCGLVFCYFYENLVAPAFVSNDFLC